MTNRYIKFLVYLTVSFFVHTNLAAQTKGEISGKVVSSETGEILENATIILLSGKDSTTITSKTTDKEGKFSFQGLNYNKYILALTYIGHDYREIEVALNKATFKLDSIQLAPNASTLDEVVINYTPPPIVVKEDTIEFNAGSYNVKPDALAEDLLKKLPGIEVDRDGNIIAHGKEITKVYVDGKPFFGGDFKMATQNLPVDIISKIQVIDKKNDRSRFTGVDDGEREKIINITIKKDKKVGYFGRANAGIGTVDRYSAGLMINSFKQQQQLSFFGSANNVNSSDMGGGMMMMGGGFGGGGRGGGGRSRGIGGMGGGFSGGGGGGGQNDVQRLGLNFRNNYNDNLDVSSSISLNRGTTVGINETNRKSLQQDTYIMNKENSRSENRTKGFNWDTDFNWRVDTMSELTARIGIRYSDGNSNQINTFDAFLAGVDPTSAGHRNNSNINDNISITGDINYMRRFKKERRSFTFRLSNNNNFSESESYVDYLNNGINIENGDPYSIEQNQLNTQNTKNNQINLSMSYSEPIFKSNMLDFTYGYNFNRSNNDRTTYDWENGKYDQLNDSLTNLFNNKGDNQNASVKFVGVGKFFNYNIGVGMQNTYQRNLNVSKDSLVKQAYTNFVPSANLSFFNRKGRNFTLGYSGRVAQPTIQQLQPVADNSNPQFEFRGNPDLSNEFTHSFNYNYQEFILAKELSIGANGSFSTTQNKILNNSYYESATGKQISSPLNVNGIWNTSFNLNASFPIIKKVLRLSFNSGGNYGNGITFIDQIKNKTVSLSSNYGGRINYDISEILGFSYSGTVRRNAVKYSSQESRNSVYTNISHSFDCTVDLPFNIEVKSGLDLRQNKDNSNDKNATDNNFNQQIGFWSAEITKAFFNRRLFMSVKGYDLLNQNQNITRMVTNGGNDIIDMVSNSLNRYFMLNVSYRLNKFGPSKKNNRNSERNLNRSSGPQDRMQGGSGSMQRGGGMQGRAGRM